MMRMDNETYRIRVQDLLGKLVGEDGQWDPEVRRRLEELAVQPRKVRHFLNALVDSPKDIQLHFYRLVLARVESKDAVSDLERHIRQRFYSSREEIKDIIASLSEPASILAIFRAIAHTEEGWLAGELIRLMLAHDPQHLVKPVEDAIQSGDYLLQCLGIYLVGKSKDEALMRILTDFYRKPFGEKLDRLEQKSLDALREGMEACPERLILDWLKDSSSRVRLLGVSAAERCALKEAVPDLVGLLLVDERTRVQTAGALLRLEEAGVFAFEPGSESAQGAEAILARAKRDPLLAAFKMLLRHDSGAVREATVKLARLLPAAKELVPQLTRLATEERLPSVQAAALETLSYVDHERFMAALADVLSEPPGSYHEDVFQVAETLRVERLSEVDQKRLDAEVERKRKKQEAALEKFAGTVEWWRHDM